MIQDLESGRLANEYKDKKITSDDSVIVFAGREVLIGRDDDNNLSLPIFSDFRKYIEEGKLSKSDFQYVFEIAGCNYFLLLSYKIDIDAVNKKENVDITSENKVQCGKNFNYEKVSSIRQLISKDICFAVMTAYHLYIWYRDNQFCGRCGCRVKHGDRILMTKYALTREYQKYALIAGFTEIGETAEETVQREVMEEVGIHVKNIKYYKSQPWGIASNLLMGFFAELDGDKTIKLDEDELSCAEWFKRENMPAHDDGISLTREMMGVFEDKEKFDALSKKSS